MRKYIVFGAILALASPVHAQNTLPAHMADDLYITLAEIRANSLDTFLFFSGPDGGPISKQKFVTTNLPDGVLEKQPDRPLLERLFGMLDANSNGELSLFEWKSGIDRDLKFADQNNDGRITLKELSTARQNMNFGDAIEMIF